jgi:putative transposase
MLLADLVDRGLDPEQAILFGIDGGNRSAARSRTCPANTRSCRGVKGTGRENMCDLLPEHERPVILARVCDAWALTSTELAEQRLELLELLELLASELDQTWPDAAASLREGLSRRSP